MQHELLVAFALSSAVTIGVAQETPEAPATQEPAPQQEEAVEPAVPDVPDGFADAAIQLQRKLEESIEELNALREQVADERLPLSTELGELEAELLKVQGEYQQTTRTLDVRTFDLTKVTRDIELYRNEATYISNLLNDYIRNFDSVLHIAERQHYRDELDTARLAPENDNLSDREVYDIQIALFNSSIDRLFEALGGARFEGAAVGSNSLVQNGTFVMIGPAAIFSAGGGDIGTAEEKVNSNEPSVMTFDDPEDTAAAAALAETGSGLFPLDPTLGNAHRMAATDITFLQEFEKGGTVMYAIFTMAGFAMLVALVKFVGMLFVRKPSRKKVAALLGAIGHNDEDEAREAAELIPGPAGKMLRAGVEHLKEPRDLIEEVMYEHVLTARLKLQRFLPFIAICAASAPLLGLLGTVTGIIQTFKLITVFGSGDVNTLSGGISEALITTKYGLVVAIPSLLLHAFLSRKARGLVGNMETTAIAFVNQVSKSPFQRRFQQVAPAAQVGSEEPDPELVRSKVSEILTDLLEPVSSSNGKSKVAPTTEPGTTEPRESAPI